MERRACGAGAGVLFGSILLGGLHVIDVSNPSNCVLVGSCATLDAPIGVAVSGNYAYVTSGAPGGRTTGVFKVADQAKALKVLKKSGMKHKEPDLHRGGTRR